MTSFSNHIKDLSGQRYGKLVAKEIAYVKKTAYWLCKCDCGNEVVVRGTNLSYGTTHSCGCLPKGSPMEDLSGKKYGRLTVIRFSHKKNSRFLWLCRCECGNEVVVGSSNFKTGNTKSCGCLNRELTAKRGAKVAKEVLALPVNHFFFDAWSNDMAYVLGFWVADGCCVNSRNSYNIRFSQKNKSFLEKIKKVIGSEHNLAHDKERDAWQLRYNSTHTYQSLCFIFGMDVQRKSKTIIWPLNMPDRYARHFMRGIIDGDGCLSFLRDGSPHLSFTSGSLLFISRFTAEMERLTGIKCNVRKRTINAWAFSLGGIKGKCFANWLYQHGDFALERKAEKAKKYREWTPNRILKKSLTFKMCNMFPQFIPEKYRQRVNQLALSAA